MQLRKKCINLFIHRFEGDDTIMAPHVIRAFCIAFSQLEEEINSNDPEKLRSSILELLSEHKFSPELSTKLVDFILEHRKRG